MILRILTQPKRRNITWFRLVHATGPRGRESESIVRSWGDLFYTLPVGLYHLWLTALFFQAHYCRGVTVSRHLATVLTVEFLLVLYSIAMSSHQTTFVFIADSPGRKVLGKLIHPLHGFNEWMSSSGLFFAYSTETCTVFKRAALDVLLAQFLFVFLLVFFPIFLLTAFSASLGAGRMILRNRFDFLLY